jgi:iron-sulfur cluster assembly protein
MSIELTPRAAEKLREIMTSQGIAEGGLRVGVQGGGCSGLSYNLSLDTEERAGDKVFEIDGLRIFVDMKSYLFVNGTTIDYKDEGLLQRGFTFNNPNSSAACGCGESFSA